MSIKQLTIVIVLTFLTFLLGIGIGVYILSYTKEQGLCENYYHVTCTRDGELPEGVIK